MIITYHGGEFFKVQFGDIVLAFNPISKKSSLQQSRFGADVAFVTLLDKDTNGVENVSRAERTPFIVSSPGEYEIGGVFVRGFPSISRYGGKERENTIYSVSLEGMNLCFLGALSGATLSSEITESLGDIDILFVPIGGDGVLTAREAYKFSITLGPRLIIPMHWSGLGEKDSLKVFLKEGGEEGQKSIDKLTVKKKELENKEAEIAVLSPVV